MGFYEGQGQKVHFLGFRTQNRVATGLQGSLHMHIIINNSTITVRVLRFLYFHYSFRFRATPEYRFTFVENINLDKTVIFVDFQICGRFIHTLNLNFKI